MEPEKYVEILMLEIANREQTLAALRKLDCSPIDPNYRLEQGYLYALIGVVKDLGNDDPGFYPDLTGFVVSQGD